MFTKAEGAETGGWGLWVSFVAVNRNGKMFCVKCKEEVGAG